MYGKVAGRVVKRPNKSGFSYGFSIVKNQRNWHTGQSEHLTVVHLGTIKDLDFDRQGKSFWNKVDSTVQILIDSGKIYANCKSDIVRKFERYIPRPTASVAAPVSVPKPKSNPDAAARLRERFKGLL